MPTKNPNATLTFTRTGQQNVTLPIRMVKVDGTTSRLEVEFNHQNDTNADERLKNLAMLLYNSDPIIPSELPQ